VTEDADRDDMRRARLESLTGVRERERLAARRNARMTGGVIFWNGLCGSRLVADADMAGDVVQGSKLCIQKRQDENQSKGEHVGAGVWQENFED
jgi:hypothetical protein